MPDPPYLTESTPLASTMPLRVTPLSVQQLLDISPDVLVVVDQAGTIVMVNEHWPLGLGWGYISRLSWSTDKGDASGWRVHRARNRPFPSPSRVIRLKDQASVGGSSLAEQVAGRSSRRRGDPNARWGASDKSDSRRHSVHALEEEILQEGEDEMAIGVLIVDDHPIVREGLRRALERDPALRVLGEAATGTEAITQARQWRPDVVLMDLSLPDLDGISATATVRRELPNTEVLVLTAMLNPTSLTQAMQAGASAYLLKDTPISEIRTAIQDTMQGRLHLSAQVMELLVTQMQPSGPADPLSQREGEVVQLLAVGRSNQEIMQQLHISEATVKAHVRHILSKLGAQSRTQAVLVAMRLGLVRSPSWQSPADPKAVQRKQAPHQRTQLALSCT